VFAWGTIGGSCDIIHWVRLCLSSPRRTNRPGRSDHRQAVGAEAEVFAWDLQDNTMCVYRGKQRVVKEVKDLLEAIERPRSGRSL
jgi:hypothetical protein